MYAQPTITLNVFSQRLHAVSATWKQAIGRFHERRRIASQERLTSGLPAHLRHDIGELDCRPPLPRPLAETLRARQTTLGSMWLSQS